MNAQHDYVIRMRKNEMPPAEAFWSGTLYDTQNGFFIPNEHKKYSVGENGGMKLNEEGGIEIYIAAEKPKGVPEENWLPIEREIWDRYGPAALCAESGKNSRTGNRPRQRIFKYLKITIIGGFIVKVFIQNMLCALVVIPFLALSASAEDTSFISKSLKEETVTAPNGAITTRDALNVNKLLGAHEKVVHEITEGVYHIRGWGIAHTIAIDAPEGWIIVDTGDTTKTAADMRKRLEEKIGKKIKVAAILYTHSHYTDGTDAWLDEGTEIWGHEHLDIFKRADTGVGILSGNFQTRAATQFGVLHPTEGPDAFPNKLGFSMEKMTGEQSYRAPTQTFEDGKILKLTIAGEPVEVAPNRTDTKDSVGFYFPDRKALVTNAIGTSHLQPLQSARRYLPESN